MRMKIRADESLETVKRKEPFSLVALLLLLFFPFLLRIYIGFFFSFFLSVRKGRKGAKKKKKKDDAGIGKLILREIKRRRTLFIQED